MVGPSRKGAFTLVELLDRINHAFADGSVRLVEPGEVRARFMGNWWNWK